MQSRHHRLSGQQGAPGSTPYHRTSSVTGSEYESDSSSALAHPVPTMVSESDFCYTTDEDEGPFHRKPASSASTLSEEREPPHPDSVIRDEVFNHLEYCGFLDIRQAFLFRWAVTVVWSMHMLRQK